MFVASVDEQSEVPPSALASLIEGPLFRSFESLPTPVALLDAEGRGIFSNAPFRKWLEMAAGRESVRDNLLGTIVSVLFRSVSRDATPQLSAFLSGEGDDLSATIGITDGDDAQWFNVCGARFEYHNDVRLLFVCENVTRAYKAEQIANDLRGRLVTSREDERQLISDELHDSTVQHVVAADLNLMRLKSRIKNDSESLEIFRDIEKSITRAIQELRVSTYLLHPLDLEQGAFSVALEQYCREFGRRTGLSVQLRHDDIIDVLGPTVQKTVLRIIQEALTNVHRHADATRVVVRLKLRNGHLHVVVSDNGRAKALGRAAQTRIGVGLSSMRLRLANLGGSLRMMSTRRGTILHGIIPQRRFGEAPMVRLHASPLPLGQVC